MFQYLVPSYQQSLGRIWKCGNTGGCVSLGMAFTLFPTVLGLLLVRCKLWDVPALSLFSNQRGLKAKLNVLFYKLHWSCCLSTAAEQYLRHMPYSSLTQHWAKEWAFNPRRLSQESKSTFTWKGPSEQQPTLNLRFSSKLPHLTGQS